MKTIYHVIVGNEDWHPTAEDLTRVLNILGPGRDIETIDIPLSVNKIVMGHGQKIILSFEPDARWTDTEITLVRESFAQAINSKEPVTYVATGPTMSAWAVDPLLEVINATA